MRIKKYARRAQGGAEADYLAAMKDLGLQQAVDMLEAGVHDLPAAGPGGQDFHPTFLSAMWFGQGYPPPCWLLCDLPAAGQVARVVKKKTRPVGKGTIIQSVTPDFQDQHSTFLSGSLPPSPSPVGSSLWLKEGHCSLSAIWSVQRSPPPKLAPP